MATQVKICGITRPEDAARAAELGADRLGLNFLAGPRKISADDAIRIFYTVPEEHAESRPWPHVALCALKKHEYDGAATWRDICSLNSSFTLQIYAQDYSSSEAKELAGLDWWMVQHVHSRESLREMVLNFHVLGLTPSAILLDTAAPGKAGGTGQSFNWSWIAEARDAGELSGLPPIVLAGGLTPDNVAQAVRIARPYAVDVSSGVEVPGKPGIKDPIKMRDFIQAAKGAL